MGGMGFSGSVMGGWGEGEGRANLPDTGVVAGLAAVWTPAPPWFWFWVWFWFWLVAAVPS